MIPNYSQRLFSQQQSRRISRLKEATQMVHDPNDMTQINSALRYLEEAKQRAVFLQRVVEMRKVKNLKMENQKIIDLKDILQKVSKRLHSKTSEVKFERVLYDIKHNTVQRNKTHNSIKSLQFLTSDLESIREQIKTQEPKSPSIQQQKLKKLLNFQQRPTLVRPEPKTPKVNMYNSFRIKKSITQELQNQIQQSQI